MLLIVTTGLWVMLQLEQFGPSVGGVIVFKPDHAPSERWSVAAMLIDTTVGFTSGAPARRCVLSPSVMAARGGSLVIEARRMSRPPLFPVPWAGNQTDMSARGCGTTADIVLERNDLMRLANVAGGFNSGPRLIGP